MKASFLLAVVLSLGTSAHPQSEHIKSNSEIEKGLPLVYQKWLTEDVRWIIKPDERVSFLRLSSDAERDDFVRQFWLRRDPTPGTEENEFKQEHYRRLAYANQHFAHTSPGWKTDRGRIYIVYGPPDKIDSKVGRIAESAHSVETWHYLYMPGERERIFEFIDTCDCGEYRLPTAPQH